jgi:parafibromin
MASDAASQDPLLSLRRAIAAGSLPTPTTSSELSDQPTTDNLAEATHLYFAQPIPQVIALNTATRFVSASTDSTVDLRSIFFAWQKKDVAIPDYIASAQELNEDLKKKEGQELGKEEVVQNLVFVERLDLITWLEGASDESEYIKPLEGAAAAAEAAAAVTGAAQAETSAGIASGATGGISSVPSGAPAAQAGAQAGRAQKPIDPRLQEIYNGERKTGDRNTVLRGIKPTVSFVPGPRP